jgi:uncharacterized protein
MFKSILIFNILIFVTSYSLSAQSAHLKIKNDTIKFENFYIVENEKKILDRGNYILARKFIEYYDSKWKLLERYSTDSSGLPTGLYQTYHPNGNLKEEYFCIRNRIVGLYIEYHSNGKLKTIGNYNYFQCYSEIIRIDSTWTEYTENGVLEKQNSTYNSTKIGKWEHYSFNGDLIKEEDY